MKGYVSLKYKNLPIWKENIVLLKLKVCMFWGEKFCLIEIKKFII